MIRLSGFGDEISADLDEQIATLRSENIRYLDLRAVWDTNVLDLSDEQAAEIRRTLEAHRFAVSNIGSPIGKVPIDRPFEEHLRRFERALELARAFGTPFVRIFSFYPPAGTDHLDDWSAQEAEVLARLRALTERASEAGVTLLHENEQDIYGDVASRCVRLMERIDHPQFQTIFDPANFILSGQTPYPDAYEALRPWIRWVHVKDASADGKIVPAGQGVGRWPELLESLRADSFGGVFSLEPHLAAAGRFQGFSGPDLFRQASQALQRLLRTMGWEYE